nr:hypothetical protein [Chitinophagaceae bacterium]
LSTQHQWSMLFLITCCSASSVPHFLASPSVDGGRVNIAACSVGGAQFCLDYSRKYVHERHQFSRPISSFQAIKFQLADMATAVHASRLLVRQAAQALDAKVSYQGHSGGHLPYRVVRWRIV